MRIYRLQEPIEIAESPHFAGWAEVKAVLSDEQATKDFKDIRIRLASR